MNSINSETYQSADVVKWYNDLKDITAAESRIFAIYESLLKNGRVLDIGIGGGRTTSWLLGKCSSYTGIDYSAGFVNLCKGKFPQADIRHMDARDLSAFESGTFDMVNFSFNGIDYVDLEGRQKILKEVYRVLRTGGVFFFSTHNLCHPTFNTLPWQRKGAGFVYNLKSFLRFAPFLWRKLRNKGSEYVTKDYAIINDHAHDFRLFTFYSAPDYIRQQLGSDGFLEVKLFNSHGRTCEDAELDDWIFVTCVKK